MVINNLAIVSPLDGPKKRDLLDIKLLAAISPLNGQKKRPAGDQHFGDSFRSIVNKKGTCLGIQILATIVLPMVKKRKLLAIEGLAIVPPLNCQKERDLLGVNILATI